MMPLNDTWLPRIDERKYLRRYQLFSNLPRVANLIFSLDFFSDHRPELEVIVAHPGASKIERLNLLIINDGDPSEIRRFLLPTNGPCHFILAPFSRTLVLIPTSILWRRSSLKLP
jgi:hypothetical protein